LGRAEHSQRHTRPDQARGRRTELRLVVSSPAQLGDFRRQVRELLAGTSVAAGEAEAIVLATAEALDNALLACRPTDCRVEVMISLIADHVCVEVRDAGAGIRGGCLDVVKLPGQGEEHGRGLYLMNELMESLELVHRSQGTLVRMTKLLGVRRPAAKPNDSTRLAS
jgi:anti-sigma regulatory factor (Ser/Thr protein kinase)